MFFSRKPGLRYVDRGDPADIDFNNNDLILDDTWHELDLSAVIPTNAKLVCCIAFVVATNLSALPMAYDVYGKTNHNTGYVHNLSTVDLPSSLCFTIPVSANRKILYNGITDIAVWGLTVQGWWI